MSETRERIHNLDELFGQNKPIIIVWEEKRYPLKHPDSFTPVEMNRFERLSKESEKLRLKDEEELSDEEAKLLGDITRKLLDLLNPDLAEKLTFTQQVNVLFFHAEEIRKEMGSQEKKTAESLIGEQSIPS